MTAHYDYTHSIDTHAFWRTVLAEMPAIEAAVMRAGHKYMLLGSVHYADTVELRDHVLSEFGRMNTVGRFDHTRMARRPGTYLFNPVSPVVGTAPVALSTRGRMSILVRRTATALTRVRTAMGVYLYNQAFQVIEHRAQDLARLNTYESFNEEKGETERLRYITHSHVRTMHPGDGENNDYGFYGDSRADWHPDCDFACKDSDRTDDQAGLECLFDMLSPEEIKVVTAVASLGSCAAAGIYLTGRSVDGTGSSYTTDEVKQVMAGVRRTVASAQEQDEAVVW